MTKRSMDCSPLSSRDVMIKRMKLDMGMALRIAELSQSDPTECDRQDLSSPLDLLPDDVIISVLATSAAAAASPTELVALSATSRRFRTLSSHPEVLRCVPAVALPSTAEQWSPASHSFLRSCAEAGNWDACALLGCVEFYCMGNRREGARLLVRAAKAGHGAALHSLALIHFNGSGSAAAEKKLSVGVLLCASAAQGGHVAALRELGHCLQDGYGIAANPEEGRRLLMQANSKECSSLSSSSPSSAKLRCKHHEAIGSATSPSVAAPAAQIPGIPGGIPPMSPRISGSGRADQSYLHQAQLSELALKEKSPGQADSAAATPSCSACAAAAVTPVEASAPAVHPINGFLKSWFASNPLPEGLKLCGNEGCGRPETRPHEFRCCAVCSGPSYCSRACQASHWKESHMAACRQHMAAVQQVAAAAAAAAIRGNAFAAAAAQL